MCLFPARESRKTGRRREMGEEGSEDAGLILTHSAQWMPISLPGGTGQIQRGESIQGGRDRRQRDRRQRDSKLGGSAWTSSVKCWRLNKCLSPSRVEPGVGEKHQKGQKGQEEGGGQVTRTCHSLPGLGLLADRTGQACQMALRWGGGQAPAAWGGDKGPFSWCHLPRVGWGSCSCHPCVPTSVGP